jgi:hypothetical protein
MTAPHDGYTMPDDPNIYSTRDLTLAATLVTLKFFLEGFDVQYEGEKNRPVAYFKFNLTPLLEGARQKYLQGMLSVEPKTFMLNVHSLKSEIENAKRNPHNPL